MHKSEIWSEEALRDLMDITQFTLDAWGVKIVARFERDVKRSIEIITQFPRIWPESTEIKGARKCVVNVHVSLFYALIDEQLYILRLHPNRRDPSSM